MSAKSDRCYEKEANIQERERKKEGRDGRAKGKSERTGKGKGEGRGETNLITHRVEGNASPPECADLFVCGRQPKFGLFVPNAPVVCHEDASKCGPRMHFGSYN